jgi:hypothetical protein
MSRKYSKESIIASIQKFYAIHGRIPIGADFNENPEYPSIRTVSNYFGKWSTALSASGLDSVEKPRKRSAYSKEACIKAIQNFKNKHGKYPASRDFVKNPEYPSYSTVKNYFGSWSHALLLAGFTEEKQDSNTKNILIRYIQKFYNSYGRIPECRDFLNNSNYPSYATYINHFGSWVAAVEAAGFIPKIQNGFGINTKALDGHIYRSKAEAYFVDNYLFSKYEYVIEPKYPDNIKKWYDWYIPSLDLYIELVGGLRPEVTADKITINKVLNRRCVFIPINVINRFNTLEELTNKLLNANFSVKINS